MAARFIQLLCMSCNVCLILHVCSLQGISGDVPDDIVYTDLHRTVHKGHSVELTCRFHGAPLAVYWKKGDDPRTAPNLVSWIPTDDVTGLCEGERPCEIMEMNENRSLVIKEVSITEQGRYICRVSSYKGILIHNFTDISVISPPMEPFPVINECQMNSPNNTETTCIISTNNSVEISCTASGYFPDIDLYFLHGSTSLHTKDTIEVTNFDGTKNKTISAIATASEISYVCFASNIPGLQEARTTTASVILPETPSPMPPGSRIPTVTRHRNDTNQTTVAPIDKTDGSVVLAVVIILAVISGCVAIVIIWCRRKRRRNQGKYAPVDKQSPSAKSDGKIEGPISYYELWCLVGKMNESDLAKLRDELPDLGILGVEEEFTQVSAYNALCDWKETNSCKNEGVKIRNTLEKYGIREPWKGLTLRRQQSSAKVSEELLDHIVRSIGEESGIQLFLSELIPDRYQTWARSARERGNNVTKAMKELIRWRDGMKCADDNYLLSVALENVSCKPLDRTFFMVPKDLLKAISPQELERFVHRLTGRHCTKLAKAVGISDVSEIQAIIDENNEDLFDTRQMISAWLAGQECSNFEKRCRLDDAIIRIGRHDMTDFFKTTSYRVDTGTKLVGPHPDANAFNNSSAFDDDLAVLVRHLPSDAMHLFLEKLGIPVDDESDDLEERLRGWRDNMMVEAKECLLQDLVSIYQEVLNDSNCSDVLGLIDGELENLVENFPSEQVQNLTSRLGIDTQNERDKSLLQHLIAWRDNHGNGTPREALRKALHEMDLPGCIVDRLPPQHVYQAEVVRLAYNILYKDVEPLATLLGMDTSRRGVVQKADNGTIGLLIDLLNQYKDDDVYRRRDFCVALGNLGYLDAARLAFFGYEESLSELCNVTSQLNKEEMEKLVVHLKVDKTGGSIGRGATEPYVNLKLITVWRNQFRTEPFHYRLKLAVGLKAIRKREIAYDVLAGKKRTSNVNPDVVEHICNGFGRDRLKRLCEEIAQYELIKESRMKSTQGVKLWVKDCLEHFDKTPARTTVTNLTKDKFTSRRLKNDEIFRAGFFELAEEIMLVEYPRFPSA